MTVGNSRDRVIVLSFNRKLVSCFAGTIPFQLIAVIVSIDCHHWMATRLRLNFEKSFMKKDFEKIIHYGIQAPSGHNTQPWKFRVQQSTILIYPDYNRKLSVVDSDNHALFISLGCALENLVIAANHLGYREKIEYYFDGNDDCIQVALTPDCSGDSSKLFDQIEKRQVTRSNFTVKQIPEQELNALIAMAKEENTGVLVFHRNEFDTLIPFIEEGNLLQFRNKSFKRELMSWVRFNDATARRTNDGLRGASMGHPSAPAWLGKLFFNLFDSAEKEMKKTTGLIRSSSLLLLFLALKNNKDTWVKLGRSYERVALKATALGIKHAHINMPCEEVTVRRKLKKKLGIKTEEPLLLIRLGYAAALPKSYRRPLEEVIVQ